MLSSPRFFFLSLCVLAVGVSLSLSRPTPQPAKGKSAEAYWAETGLGSAAFEDLISDQVCSSSERYYLACINALLAVSNRFNLGLNHEGEFVSFTESVSGDSSSEKTQLEPWRKYFSEHTALAMTFPFEKAWGELRDQHIKPTQMSMMVGVGLNGFISVFRDPHTYLMPVDLFKDVVSKVDNKSQSLGLVLGRSKGHYVIKKVLPGSPANKAGVLKGDIISSIDAQSIKNLVQPRVSELLKGEIGSEVALSVVRAGQVLPFNILREETVVPTVSVRVVEGIKPVGVLTINKFAKSTCEKAKTALIGLEQAQIRGLLLDLRDNPGGQMEEAACVASLFVGSDKKIFELRYLDPSKKNEVYFGSEEKIFDLPVAILVNSSSASAAEIVAGALRDLNRAVLVGERTFGKGSFQEGELWSQNKKIALFETKGFYYLPTGRSPQRKGLAPDVDVHFDDMLVSREEDQFLNPLQAPERRVKAAGPVLATSNCLELADNPAGLDRELTKARQILFCSKTAIGANQ